MGRGRRRDLNRQASLGKLPSGPHLPGPLTGSPYPANDSSWPLSETSAWLLEEQPLHLSPAVAAGTRLTNIFDYALLRSTDIRTKGINQLKR
ncbi:hypothetical protein Y1Q_0023452 [Alligator mississippiensis]|uniref:Uncharacterized protein n=1 Tax=Alligator mississippiensis TaxID=8496 RepID=A0A151NPJ8_ALLMI|nr:hypothetical protein Y1Q_0023452 [Alligator mississippiensis]